MTLRFRAASRTWTIRDASSDTSSVSTLLSWPEPHDLLCLGGVQSQAAGSKPVCSKQNVSTGKSRRKSLKTVATDGVKPAERCDWQLAHACHTLASALSDSAAAATAAHNTTWTQSTKT